MQPHNFFSTDATPSHSSRKNLILNSKKSPGSTQEVSESENRPATRGTAHSEVQGDARGTTRCTARCRDRPMAALHFLLPTGDSRSGRRSFDSKHLPSPARRGSRSRTASPPASLCDSKGSECPCGIHTAEAASALRSRKTERAAKEKPTPISQFFFSTCCAWHPNSAPRPGEAPHPAPSARKSATRTAQKTALCAPR